MKKRLLSAALALAMVLTMLPLTVFADTTPTNPSSSTGSTADYTGEDIAGVSDLTSTNLTFKWYKEGEVVKAKSGTMTEDAKAGKAGYYYYGTITTKAADADKATTVEAKLYHASEGIIEGTSGTSGYWHKTAVKTEATADKAAVLYTSFTLVSNYDGGISDLEQNLSINLHGNDVTLTLKDGTTKVTSLTITNTAEKANPDDVRPDGTVTLDSSGWTITGASFNLSVTNAEVDGNIEVKREDNGTTARTLTATTLNNAKVGDLTCADALRVNATNGSEVGDLTCTNAKADIDITKSSHGDITLGDTQGTNDYSKTGGTIDLTGVVVPENGAAGTITTRGGATINVKDFSTVGTITVLGGLYDDATKKTSGAKTAINVSGQSTTGAITDETNNAQPVEVSVSGSGSNNGVASITLDSDYSHIVKIVGGRVGTADAVGALAMTGGTLTVSDSANVGAITLGANGSKAAITANISGADTKIVSLTRSTTADSTINISGGTFEATTDCVKLGADYKKQTITGGTFGSSLADKGWLKDVTYEIKREVGGKSVYTYTKNFQDVVDATKNNPTGTTLTVTAVGASTGDKTVKFYLDGEEEANIVATIKTDASVPLILPTSVNGTNVSTWFVGPNKSSFTAGDALPLRDADKDTGTGAAANTWSVYTDSTLAVNGEVTEVSAEDGITAKLENGTIKLTGTVDLDTGVSKAITLKVKTDAGKEYTVIATYFQTQKDVIVSDLGGMESSGNKGIRVPGSTTVWTVDGKSLVEKQGDTKIGLRTNVKADVHLSVSGKGDAEKKLLEDALKQTVADFSKSPAIEQALNKVLGSINLTTAQRTGRTNAAKAEGHTSGLTDKFLGDNYSGWKVVEVRPLLYITASNWVTTGTNHSIDLDIKPYYQLMLVDPDHSTDASKAMPAGNVTALSLDSSADAGAVKITLTLPTGFTTSTNEIWAHHGDYVYQVQSDKSFINIHGFSLFRINGVKPLASIADGKVQNPVNDPASTSSPVAKIQNYYYDDLQVAVDEVADTGVITVNAGYPANETRNLSVTGKARAFKVKCTDGTLALTFNVDAVKTGDTYDVKLEKDNLTTAKIVVGTATNGAAAVSVVNANRGSTVTGTLSPSKGYKVGTVTAKSNTGANVSVSVDTTKNTFSFVVPSDATSVTVTPTFVVDDGMDFVDVNENDWFYDGVYYCFTHNAGGQPIMEGTDATHFYPGSTLVRGDFVKVLWRLAGAPVETPTVTYSDVPSSYHAYNAIVWATNHGIAKGYGDGTFKPTVGVSRQEMVTFLWRAAESPKVSLDLASRFTDGGGVASWAREAMQWAAGLNILCGVSSVNVGSTLYPWAQAQRAQIAVTAATYHDMYIS